MDRAATPPNLILLITDQQRRPQHWPEDRAWLEELAPADAELRRTGVTFTRAFTATAMCSPSRASLLTGLRPSRHGVTLTLTEGDLWPARKHAARALRSAVRMALRGELPRRRLARTIVRNALRLGPKSGNEPELPSGIDNLATLLRRRGYHVAMKGKWHLSKPVSGDEWSEADTVRIERDYGFAEWEPPDSGGDTKAENFGGGTAGTSHGGWDEDYTRQVERWLARADLPEPFCLVFSLVNPHDVLGYPTSYLRGGYDPGEFRDLGVPLPPTLDEDLREKPAVHALSKVGMDNYLGPLRDRQARQDYVNFYAHLHRVVDEKIGRLLSALGPADDPRSLRSRTVILRTSDHGEMGLSHGGLRQKVFNAYEETIAVPFVVSAPGLFGGPRESDALVSLLDVVPTFLGLAGGAVADADGSEEGDLGGEGLDGGGLGPACAVPRPDRFDGRDLGPLLRGEAPSVRDAVLFTYDDHQAGTALQEAAPGPNRVRCVRDSRWKYAVYLHPTGRDAPEYEMYDLLSDPCEAHNLLDKRTGRVRSAAHEPERLRLAARLSELCAESGTDLVH
jgi:choline-sulfatase